MKDGLAIGDGEYSRMSDQKAEDWRAISEVTPTLFGVAGAIFAAGVAAEDALILALSPLPIFFGVFHMVRSAKLQLQMITYLATHSPPGAGRWEKDVAAVRPEVWSFYERQGIAGLLRKRSKKGDDSRLALWLAELTRPSAWNTWLWIAGGTDVLVCLVAVLAGYESWPAASVGNFLVVGALAVLIVRHAHGIQRDRELWTTAWKAHAADEDVVDALIASES